MDQDIPSPKRPSKKIKKKSKPITFEEGSSSNDLVIVDEIVTTPPKAKTITPVKNAVPSTSSSSKRRKKRDSASSDEERWLTAIESGKLEDVDDELKKIKSKDPALMTARQRAMYDRTGEGTSVATPTLMSLPTGYKEKVMTAEAIQKAAIKSQKRKQLADEKREKDKKKTMEKLLKKQDSKAIKQARPRVVRTTIPSVLYKQTCDITILAFPEGFDFPLKVQQAPKVPSPVYCSMGCGNVKKYSCAQTGVPLCSLRCYKNNIARFII
ncbi:INO80 complex subunit B [Diabrotica virgifera virgifera]|uniref:INO80 complex subunit B-like conserved region domain-containing protein n=1 Tax=Diabrotica virgifera virgifera TaxID=50390 RepID=A0ABM5KKF4_DIAVI|nr:INO80 complex subunit B [Diabrotica virgifera virgifera]